MRTSDFYMKPNAKALNESLSQKFGEKLDIDHYSTEQLERASNLIEGKITALKKGKFNETLESEEFHRLKLMHDVVKTALSERAVSKSQQQAAGAALAAKRKGTTKDLKGASKEMMKMSTKELEKVAGTKHKGLPKKVGESSKAKPDFLDMDKDGNKKEPMKKALKDKGHKKVNELGPKTLGSYVTKVAKLEPHQVKPSREKGIVQATQKLRKKEREPMAESYIAIGRYLMEGEEGKAELIMAVKDMVDKFTGWSEDIAQMQAQTAMEMADAIRDEMGSDAAEQFTAGVQPALDAAFQAVKSAREALNGQVGTLTGNAPAPMGAEPEAGADLDAAGADTDLETDLDTDVDIEAPAEEPADRAKRESIERRMRLTKVLSSR